MNLDEYGTPTEERPTPFTYITTPQLERAVLRDNPEFESFAQACVYLFNVGCTDTDEWGQVLLTGEPSNLMDAIRYFANIKL